MISLGGAGIQNAIVEACLLTNIVPHFSLKFVIGFFPRYYRRIGKSFGMHFSAILFIKNFSCFKDVIYLILERGEGRET